MKPVLVLGALMVLLWVTETLPLAATAMLPLVFVPAFWHQ